MQIFVSDPLNMLIDADMISFALMA